MMKTVWRVVLCISILVVFWGYSSGVALADEGEASGSVTVQVTAWQGTYINMADPGRNYGSISNFIMVGSNDPATMNDHRGLVQFNLPSLPADAVIESATLQLQTVVNMQSETMATPPAGQYIGTRLVTSSWLENSVTWSSQPSFSPSPVDPSTFLAVDTTGSVTWNVTNAVRDWVDGSQTNYGLMLLSSSPYVEVQAFYSSAVLYITYQTTTPTPTPTRTPTLTRTPTPTRTLTPTPTATNPCPQAVISADMDTYTDSSRPAAIEGLDPSLVVARDGSTQKYIYLYFPFEGVVPQSEYIYEAKIQLSTDVVYGDQPGPWTIMAFGLAEPFDQATTNWSNQPAIQGSLGLGDVDDSQYGYIDITAMARRWQSGAEVNNGVVLMPVGPGDFTATYHSANAGGGWYTPKLIIGCGSEAPTSTPTRTSTPTPTNTPTPTATSEPPTVNLIPIDIEVTQGLQDLANSIPLFNEKRTLVRFHAYAHETGAPQNGYFSRAELEVWRDGSLLTTLTPANAMAGRIWVQADPSRADPMASFNFELPTDLAHGTLTLKAEVNPGCLSGSGLIDETWCMDNWMEETVSFREAPTLAVGLFSVGYDVGDGTHVDGPTYSQVLSSVKAMKELYPIKGVNISYGPMTSEGGWMPQFGMVGPAFGQVNQELVQRWNWDRWTGAPLFNNPTVRYAGFTTYQNHDLAGLSAGIPGVASTTNVNASVQVFAHELGHNMGRHHTPYCNAGTGCVWGICPDGFEHFPYAHGYISPVSYEWIESAVQGLKFTETGYDIKNVDSMDLMTYCFGSMWISKFTFERILSYLDDQASMQVEPERLEAEQDYLLVSGYIDSETGDAELSTLFVLPSNLAYRPEVGDYEIVLRDSSRRELARYPFSPPESVFASLGEPAPDGPLMIQVAVPYDQNTAEVDLEGPDGRIAWVVAGMSTPQVTLRSPNGGEFLDGDPIMIDWTARDTDGDRLTFNVDYSVDNGRNWQLLASDITGSSVEVPARSVPASDRGRMRVWVSDGIHTASDSSDTWFTVPNRPPVVEISQPADGVFAVVGQSVFFEALAYDPDVASMADINLQWNSSLDGAVGQGEELTLASLSQGTHQIMVIADDGAGGVGADTVTVTIVGSAEDLPQLPDQLLVTPLNVHLDTSVGMSNASIFLHNSQNPDPIDWSASASEPWLILSSASSQTPATLEVSVDPQALAPGEYSAVVTITNSQEPAQYVEVLVSVVIQPNRACLPFIAKQP